MRDDFGYFENCIVFAVTPDVEEWYDIPLKVRNGINKALEFNYQMNAEHILRTQGYILGEPVFFDEDCNPQEGEDGKPEWVRAWHAHVIDEILI